jgi:hypothetical protein
MHLVFVDDAKQKPSRPGMGQLVAAGALMVPDESVRTLETALSKACTEHGFPEGEEFKWSPRRDTWMYRELVEDRRESFLRKVMAHLAAVDAVALVVIVDATRGPANKNLTAEQDTIVLLLERIATQLKEMGSQGVVIADRPGGGRKDENIFLAECLQTITTGTRYVQPDEICLVLSTDSKHVRLLQAADAITSCTTAYVAGEGQFSPDVMDSVKPLFARGQNRVGGYGVKLHPDFCFVNLYHWLFGDSHHVRYPLAVPLPLRSRPYSLGPDEA